MVVPMHVPDEDGNAQPQGHCHEKDQAGVPARQKLPNGHRKTDQPYASHHCAPRIEGRCLPSPIGAQNSCLPLLFLLILLYKSCASRKYRGKCKEEASHCGAKPFRQQPGHDCDRAPKQETYRMLLPIRLSQTLETEMNSHDHHLKINAHAPKATMTQQLKA